MLIPMFCTFTANVLRWTQWEQKTHVDQRRRACPVRWRVCLGRDCKCQETSTPDHSTRLACLQNYLHFPLQVWRHRKINYRLHYKFGPVEKLISNNSARLALSQNSYCNERAPGFVESQNCKKCGKWDNRVTFNVCSRLLWTIQCSCRRNVSIIRRCQCFARPHHHQSNYDRSNPNGAEGTNNIVQGRNRATGKLSSHFQWGKKWRSVKIQWCKLSKQWGEQEWTQKRRTPTTDSQSSHCPKALQRAKNTQRSFRGKAGGSWFRMRQDERFVYWRQWFFFESRGHYYDASVCNKTYQQQWDKLVHERIQNCGAGNQRAWRWFMHFWRCDGAVRESPGSLCGWQWWRQRRKSHRKWTTKNCTHLNQTPWNTTQIFAVFFLASRRLDYP